MNITDAAKAVFDLATRRELLPVEAAWRLDSRIARELTQDTGHTPAGGWSAFVGLLAGAQVLKATHDGFEPLGDPAKMPAFENVDTAKTLLAETFTVRLIPPASAAGLFILLAIHPAWGLRVAHNLHSDQGLDTAGAWKDDSLFDADTADRLRMYVSSAVYLILQTLVVKSNEANGGSVSTDEFSTTLVGELSRLHGKAVKSFADDPAPGLDPLMSSGPLEGNYRVLDFVTSDLLDGWLVPAGLVERDNKGGFVVTEPKLISELEVF